MPQGTVLGPTLFLVFINDIASNINSTIRLFAGDCVIYRAIRLPSDHEILQGDLEKLVEWSNTWQMEFNVDKCAIMNITTKRNKSVFDYSMKSQIFTYLLTGVRNYTTTPVSTMKDVVRLRSSTSPYSFCWRVVS